MLQDVEQRIRFLFENNFFWPNKAQEKFPRSNIDDMEYMPFLLLDVHPRETGDELYMMRTIMIRTYHGVSDSNHIQNISDYPALGARLYIIKKMSGSVRNFHLLSYELIWMIFWNSTTPQRCPIFPAYLCFRKLNINPLVLHVFARCCAFAHHSDTINFSNYKNSTKSSNYQCSLAYLNESASGCNRSYPLLHTPEDCSIHSFRKPLQARKNR